jgi:glycosyltransferase involved in cell wall biosynthesis
LARLRVLIVCGSGIVSGKEIMTLELARGLRSSDLDVHVLTSTWGSEAFPPKLEELGVPFDRLPLGFISATMTLQCLKWTYGQIERWPELLLGYRSLLRARQPGKIIHTNWQHLLLLLPFVHSHRDLFWVHDVFPNKPQYRRLFQILNRRLQGFVPVSHATAESLQRIGIPEQKIQVIHNGLDDPAVGSERKSDSNGATRLGIVGQIGDWKGHSDLLEAFGQVGVQFPGIELHIFGRGGSDYEYQLRQRSADLGIADRVTWHGFVRDRGAIFRSLDVLIIPSRVEESFGLVAAEAGFFGLPVVVARQGGLLEIVEDGVTGILVPSDNPTALAEGIRRLLANPALRVSMGVKARQRMLDRFSSERFVNDFLLLLRAQAIQ